MFLYGVFCVSSVDFILFFFLWMVVGIVSDLFDGFICVRRAFFKTLICDLTYL